MNQIRTPRFTIIYKKRNSPQKMESGLISKKWNQASGIEFLKQRQRQKRTSLDS